MDNEACAAKAEPKTAFPWRGFYGGKVKRILIEYADLSSTNLGLASCIEIELAQDQLRGALCDAERAIASLDEGDLGHSWDGHGNCVGSLRDELLTNIRAALAKCSTPDAQPRTQGDASK